MQKRIMKVAALAALSSGTLFQLDCLFGGGFWRQQLLNAAISQGFEYLFDNNGSPLGFDLFPDDGTLSSPLGGGGTEG